MARNKFTFYLDWTLNPEQLDLVGKTATMLTDRPGKHAQLCDEISQELKSFLVRRSIAADKLSSKAVRDRLDRARRHCRGLIAVLDAKEFGLDARAAWDTLARISVEMGGGDGFRDIYEVNSLSRGGFPENADRINTLCQQLDELADSIDAAYESVEPASRGRPRDEALAKLVRGLAGIFRRETGGTPRANYDDANGTCTGPFFGLVLATLEAIGESFDKRGKMSLGKAINRSLGIDK